MKYVIMVLGIIPIQRGILSIPIKNQGKVTNNFNVLPWPSVLNEKIHKASIKNKRANINPVIDKCKLKIVINFYFKQI